MRGWIKRLEHAARGEFIEIPQANGTVARFPLTELEAAYLSAYEGALGGESQNSETPEEHPMLEAIRNSSEPEWRSMWDDLLTAERDSPVEDLSEP